MDQSNDGRVLDDKIQQLTKLYMSHVISKDEFESRKKEIMDSYSTDNIKESRKIFLQKENIQINFLFLSPYFLFSLALYTYYTTWAVINL